MEMRTLEIRLISATDLKNVNTFSKMDVYVSAQITGDRRSTQRSPVVKSAGTWPNWGGHLMKFAVPESATQDERAGITFYVMSDRALGNTEVGRLSVPLRELFDAAAVSKDDGAGAGNFREVEYKVRRPSGRAHGTMRFGYRFGEKYQQQKSVPVYESVVAYPAGVGTSGGGRGYPMPAAAAAYPPTGVAATAPYPPPGVPYQQQQQQQPQPYPYPYQQPAPSQYGYYTGQPAGYGYGGGYGQPGMMAPAQKPNRGRFGMGSAAMGLGAGLLGGMLVGEMVEDVAEAGAYDDMYDGGGDFGGGDFDM